MKLTNGQIVDAASALQGLVKIKLPVRVSYKIARLVTAVRQAVEPYDIAKAALVEQYRAPEQEGAAPGTVTITPEGVAAYSELLKQEAEVAAEPLSLDELGDAEIEPSVLVGLGPLLTDG